MKLNQNELEDKLCLLKNDFINKLNYKVGEIETCLSQYLSHPGDKKYYFELKRKLHNLVGTSGLHDLSELNKKAREIELLIMDVESKRMSQSFKENLRSHIISLKSLCKRIALDDNKTFPKYNLDVLLNIPPLNILIGTDDKEFEEILKVDLCMNEHKLTFYDNGSDVLGHLGSSLFDLIILEISLPSLDGYETTRAIRDLSSDMYIPILFITSENREEYLTRCIDVGGDDFLVKPYAPGVLNAKIFSLHRLASKINMATLSFSNDKSALGS